MSQTGASDDGRLDCDVCVIGTGPAGSTIARELSGSGLRVIVVESGGEQREPDQDALDEIESVGWPRELDQWLVRNRMLGGSSNTWWGRCRPFDPIDFETRDWVPASGWSFTQADLGPYLERAAVRLGLPAAPPPEAAPSPGGSSVLPTVWAYSRDTDAPREPMRFGRRLARELGRNVTLLLHSTVVAIHAREGGSVDGVEIADRAGERRRITAGAVVLCAGGIENARLLLASRLGNDLVGRYLMDHPRGTVARFQPGQASALLRRFGWRRTPSGRQVWGFRLSPQTQRQERLLNCAGWPEGVLATDDPVEVARRLVRRESNDRVGDVATVVRQLPFLARGAGRTLRGQGGADHRYSEVTLQLMCEQVPDPASRVVLAERTDRFGVPLSRIDWRVGEQEARTLRRTTALITDELQHLGLPAPVPEAWVQHDELPPPSWTDIAHPTGTTRMSRSSDTGVVNAQCELHDVRGVFVAGSSVFPTAGHANPTQMIVALAIRLADHLKATVSSTP